MASTPVQPTRLNTQSPGQSCKPPKVVCIPLDFSLASQYTLDLKPLQDLGAFDTVLSTYIDNRASAQRFDMLMGGTLQTISAPAGTQGYYTVLATNEATLFTFTSTGGVLVNLFLLNFDVAGVVWKP